MNTYITTNMRGISYMSTELTVWEQNLFTVLSSETASMAEINAVLSRTPKEVSSAISNIVLTSLKQRRDMDSTNLAVEFLSATRASESRSLLDMVAWSQDPGTWNTDPENFNRHLELVDKLTDEEGLQSYQGFLMFVWDQVLSEVRERLEDADHGELDFEKFEYLVDRIEEYATI